MKSFLDFLLERLDNSKGTLSVFDIDQTLFDNPSRTRVVSPKGEVKARLSTQGLEKHKLQQGDKFDFSEFSDSKQFSKEAKPVKPMFKKAKSIVNRQGPKSKSILVTGRPDLDDRDRFLQKFRQHGFPVDKTHIHRAGNIVDKSQGKIPTHMAKALIMRKHLKTGQYHTAKMYDDSEKNLSMFLKLQKLHPDIRFKAFHVDPNTGTRRRFKNDK